MTTSRRACAARRLGPLAAALIALSAGCATLDAAPRTAPPVQEAAAGTQAIGDFSAGRRCMDNLLLDYAARDITVIVEDVADRGKPGQAETKDMLVAAVSDMTQRSRAIRLIASGEDWSRTLSHMTQAGKREPLALMPQYALRGSISRPDNSAFSLDLTLLATQDMSVVPGTASRNAVSLFAGRAELSKFGQRFSVVTSVNEGPSQAMRAMVEVAAIELFGRLTKVPYWTCLGATGADPTVSAEVQDWYDVMAARPAELISYFQGQLRTRRVYDGPIDGAVNEKFKDAVARYRAALGLSREAKLSLDFFKAYLGADHLQLAARVPVPNNPAATGTTRANATAATAPAPAAAAPLALRIDAGNDARRFARGEAVQLTIRPNREAHVYCYLQDESRKISRFFPNRFQRDSRVEPGAGLQLPGAMRFEIVLNPRGVAETVTCFATERDVLPQLPAGVNAGDFDPLPMASFDPLRQAFAKASGGALAQESFQIRPK